MHDVVIVGGGAAGCVLASRLSEDPGRHVLLLEAGADTPPGSVPPDILDPYPRSYFNPRYRWPGLQAHWRRAEHGAATPLEQGRIMGGSSSIMGMVALRGTPADYAEWEAVGASGWGWEDVLPYFRKLEADADMSDELHGLAGPVQIARNSTARWPAVARAGLAYANRTDIPFIADANGDFRDGYCAVPVAAGITRSAASLAYLGSSVRARANLSIVPDCRVSQILLDGRRASGVVAECGGERRQFHAREVVIAAGALQSPQLLLRAGIGPVRQLQSLGIPVVQDLPGVGENLQNHPVIYLGGHLDTLARDTTTGNHNFTSFRWSSGLAGAERSDMYLTLFNRTSWHALGRRIAGFSVVLNKPRSRGWVRLHGTGREAAIEFNFLDEALDLERMATGVVHACAMLASPEFTRVLRQSFPIVRSDRVRQLNRMTRGNAWRARALSAVLDAAPFAAEMVLSKLVASRVDLAALARNPELLRVYVLANIAGLAHHVGTCRMGSIHDRMAVVDPEGRVHGVQGLRVADASVMPTLPRANTFLPTVMVAEKIAAAVRARSKT